MNSVLEEDFEKICSMYSELFEQLKGGRVLITGECGMITSYLSLLLISVMKRYDLTLYLQARNISNLQKKFGLYKNSRLFFQDFSLIEGDIPDIYFDYIIHAASPASTKFFKEQPVDVIAPNVIGTWNLLQFCKNKKVKKFLFFSSNSIYGEFGDKLELLSESDYGTVDPISERSCYIESKRLCEQMCVAFSKQYGIHTNSIRICHTYGPTFNLDQDTRIIPRVIKNLINGNDIVIYKDPSSIVQYTYVADMVTAVLFVLLKGKNGEVYNGCGDECILMDDAIEIMFQSIPELNSKITEKEIDDNYNFSNGKGVNLRKISNDKIKSLGWKPLFTNIDGFSRSVRSYILDQNDSKLVR